MSVLVEKNKNLTLNRYDPLDRIGWEDMRKNLQGMDDFAKPIRVGGSDVGVIMGLSTYKSRGALFYEMIGLKEAAFVMNLHTFRGTGMEQLIIDWWWQYFDPSAGDDAHQLMMEANRAGKPVRSSKPLHAMVVNKAYDNLLLNVDNLINPDEDVLEIKSMYGTALDKWEAGIPPAHVAQLQTYNLGLEKDKGEVFILADATYPVLFQFDSSSAVQENILYEVGDFCERVNGARQGILKAKDESEAFAIAADFEPPPEETPAYIQFLKESHRPENQIEPLIGDDYICPPADGGKAKPLIDHVLDYSKIKGKIADLSEELVIPEVHIRDAFRKNGVNKIDFDEYPSISWNKKFTLPYKKFLE
jgi:hypothetical protein